eukprot:gene12466-11776_t
MQLANQVQLLNRTVGNLTDDLAAEKARVAAVTDNLTTCSIDLEQRRRDRAGSADLAAPNYVANSYEFSPTRNMQASAAAQFPPVLPPSLGAATTAVYSTAIETGDVIYVADGNGDPSTATTTTTTSSRRSNAQSSTQNPAVPADGPSADTRTLARMPNPIYQPASNNTYDAGVNINRNRNSNSNSNRNRNSNSNSNA